MAEEGIKRESNNLRGALVEDLSSKSTNVTGPSEHLLKFHGIYAQDNRDVRRERTQARAPLEYFFMIRVAIPGGQLDSSQWLTLDRIAGELADGSIRLTTRQAVQFHGVSKFDLRTLATRLHAEAMTSFAACGDVVRNTVMCPGLVSDDAHTHVTELAGHLARTFKPATRAHWEIFVDGQRAASLEPDTEHEFYGDTYLPRKFKIAIAHPDENCVDVLAQDVGLITMGHPQWGAGYNVVVGGGLGRSYAQPDTFARLATPLTFVTAAELDDLIRAVLSTYRDLGDRTNRRRARLKYVVADRGVAAFAAEVQRRYGESLRPALPVELGEADDHLGWRTLSDGRLEIGIRVGAGRVRDDDGVGLRSALRELATRRPLRFLITAQQDIVVSAIAPEDRGAVDEILARHGVRAVTELGAVERSALACPALPTCGQALAESERRLPALVDGLEATMSQVGLTQRRLQLRVTGCPNGCARPAVAEVGVVGRTKNSYDLYLGGGPRGDRLASLHQEKLTLDEIPGVLAPLLARWRDEGRDEESFGDFYSRLHGS
ncbi:MAG: NADPH-dependent assimilatory sulfite reductase hemoprotein subunit [Acidobacteria bacterium]|nr:NADPH-dependent assimilatory sulfite reductase hemoprotein subunit [Acidobacteriota bacterium]